MSARLDSLSRSLLSASKARHGAIRCGEGSVGFRREEVQVPDHGSRSSHEWSLMDDGNLSGATCEAVRDLARVLCTRVWIRDKLSLELCQASSGRSRMFRPFPTSMRKNSSTSKRSGRTWCAAAASGRRDPAWPVPKCGRGHPPAASGLPAARVNPARRALRSRLAEHVEHEVRTLAGAGSEVGLRGRTGACGGERER